MRVEEAEELGRILKGFSLEELSPLLNLGSGSAQFREEEQPHIFLNMIKPLQMRGIDCVHADIRDEAGVDMVGDLADDAYQDKLRELAPRSVLLNNFLEHVRNPTMFTEAIETFLQPGGLAIISVPYSYPYHLDPIDTGFRPTPEEIAELFKECDLIEGQIITSSTYIDHLKAMPRRDLFLFLSRAAVRFFTPFYRFERWKSRFHRFLWLFRSYKVSVAVLRKRRHGDSSP